jgi:hypothetical protein
MVLNVKYFNNSLEWDSLVGQCNGQALLFPLDNANLISSVHSPRSIGHTNNSLVFRWTTREDIEQGKDWELALDFTYPDVKVKEFISKESWTDILETMIAYLNNYVRPHEVYSISVFEDNHLAKVDSDSGDSEEEDSDSLKTKEEQFKPNFYRATVVHDGDGTRPLNIEEIKDSPDFPPYNFKIFDDGPKAPRSK